LDFTPKTQAKRTNGPHQPRTGFWKAKKAINRVKRQQTEWGENVSTYHLTEH
jgi:hypothetical protein